MAAHKPGDIFTKTNRGIQYKCRREADGSTTKLERITPYVHPTKANKRSKIVSGNPAKKEPRYEAENKPPGENTLKGLRGSRHIHIAEHSREVAKVVRRDSKTFVIQHKK